jgi:hypothetical protein
MARSSIPDAAPGLAPQGVHFALSVGLPTAAALVAEWWLSGPPSWPLAPVALVYTAVLALWSPWRLRTRQGPLLKVWFWIVATAALWVALAAAEGLPWPRTLGFEGRHALWFGVAFAQGQLAVLWAGQLASRARLFQLIEGIPEGRALEERVRDFQLDADYSRANHGALTASLIGLSVSAVVLSVVTPARARAVSTGLLVAFLVLCLLVGVLLRTYRREMEALMYGRRLSLADKLQPLGWSALLVAVAALGAWGLLALGGPWLDFSHWLPDRLQVPESTPPLPAPRPPLEAGFEGDYRLLILLTLLSLIFQLRHIGLFLGFVLQLLLWAVPCAVAAFLLWPVVRWVLAGGRETKGLWGRWRRLLQAQWKAFLAAVALWWRGRGEAEGSPLALGTFGARDWLMSLIGRPVAGRRRPYPEVVEAFLTLARWAEPKAVYRRGETTREFLVRLAEALPESAADVRLLGDLLDRELFGLGLDPQEREGFLLLVKTLTAVPLSQDPPPGVS